MATIEKVRDSVRIGYTVYDKSSSHSQYANIDLSLTKTKTSRKDWKARIATLQDATNPYIVTGRSFFGNSGKISCPVKNVVTKETWEVGIEGNWLTTAVSVVAPGIDTNLLNLTIGRFYSKTADAMAPFKGFVFLGELRESASTIHSLSQDVLSLFRATLIQVKDLKRQFRRSLYGLGRQRKRDLTKQFLESVSNRWLEWSFGVQPILFDIESAAEAFTKPRRELRRIRASGTKQDPYWRSVVTGYLPHNVASYLVDRRHERKWKIRCVGAFVAEYPGSENSLTGSAERYGLAFREFLPSLWELTPWSWAADYFVNVGDVLNTLAYHDVDWIYRCVSSRSEEMSLLTVRPMSTLNSGDNVKPNGSISGSGCRAGQKAFSFKRSPLSGFEVGFAVKYPQSWKQQANLLAASVQKIGKSVSLL
jgi:hypothetical protein